jgi:hypothetical protein
MGAVDVAGGRDRARERTVSRAFGVVGVAAVLAACAPASRAPAKAATGSGDVTVSADPLDGRRWLDRDAATAVSLGAGPLRVAATDVGSDGDRVGTFVAIPNDQCLLAYARGSYGVDDLDLYAYADDGTTLAADEASDPHPAIVICPPHPGRAYVVARVAQGHGIVAVGVHSVSTGAIGPVGKALGARGRPGEETGRVEAWPGLDERVAERRRAIGGRWEEVRRVAVPADARAPTRVTAPLEPGRCLDVLVLPGEELQQLDMVLYDGDGRIVARGAPSGRDRVAVVCTHVETTVGVELRAHAGQGLAAVVLARTPVGGEGELAGSVDIHRIGATLDVAAARGERAKSLHGLGFGDAVAVGAGTADVGRRASFPIDLPEGCARIDLVGGRPIAGLLADLWDPAGSLVARGDGSDAPTLWACGKGGKGRIDVEATSRPGPFAIDLRKDRAAPPILVAHPLAAGRLLSYLDARAPITAGAAGDARAIALDATSLKTFDLSIPEGRCVDVIAALDAGGAGIDLRLVDPRAGEQALTRGRSLASARTCATTGGARSIQAELRLDAGKTDALVLTRPVAITPGR